MSVGLGRTSAEALGVVSGRAVALQEVLSFLIMQTLKGIGNSQDEAVGKYSIVKWK